MQSTTRYIFTGILTIIPLCVTGWIIWFVVSLLISVGRPAVIGLAAALRPRTPGTADLLLNSAFQSALALLLVLVGLYLLGRIANDVVGRRFLKVMARLVESIPFANTIYGATQTLIDSLRGEGGQTQQRIVLIEFPTPEMKAVGFVTRIFPETDYRPELAAVYVPTTPNPTSGYVEIVPTARVVWLDWTKNEAMAFIVSGGAMAPETLKFHADGKRTRPKGAEGPPDQM